MSTFVTIEILALAGSLARSDGSFRDYKKDPGTAKFYIKEARIVARHLKRNKCGVFRIIETGP